MLAPDATDRHTCIWHACISEFEYGACQQLMLRLCACPLVVLGGASAMASDKVMHELMTAQ
jgi:hypothetical protein